MAKILYVEDQETWQELVSHYLGRVHGQEVQSVATLAEALEALQKESWDLVIVDLTLKDAPLPGEGVFAVVEKILERHPLQPIMILSGREVTPSSGLLFRVTPKAVVKDPEALWNEVELALQDREHSRLLLEG